MMSAIKTSQSASKHFQNRSAVLLLVLLMQVGLCVCGDGES